jgi:N-acetylmuramoyl-L-alanine amidase
VDDGSLHVIAHKADGAMRDALTLLDQTVAFCGTDIHYEDVIRNLGVLDYDYSFRLVDASLAGDYAQSLLLFDEVLSKGFNAQHFVAALSTHLRDLLVISGYEVQVTRDTDRSIHDQGIEGIANQKASDMDNRLAILNAPEHAVCISIHQNQFTDPKYSGAQMFYAPTNSGSESLAQTMQQQFHTMLQPQNDREIKCCGKELFLCWFCKHPMIMAECGFLSNPDEAALLKTEEYQHKTALTLYAGLLEWLSKQGAV